MDLLAGYSDENSKQSPSLNQNNQSSSSKMAKERSLEDEWASFEKLIDGDAILENKDDEAGTSGEQKEKRKFSEGASTTYSFEVQSGSSSDSSSRSFSPVIILNTEVESNSKEKESEKPPLAFRPKKDSGKGSSNSRSRSRSVSPRQHRKSKDKRSRSRSKDRSRDKKSHSRRERRRHRSPHSKRSRSRSQKRSSSKHRSRSRDRKRGSKERRSSRDKHRHRSHDRSHKRKHRSKSRSPRRHRSKSRSPRRHRSKSPRRHRRSRSPRRRRSYSRSRSPSPRYKSVPISSYQKKISGTLAKKPMTFREKMRQDLIKAGKLLDGVGVIDPNGDTQITPQMALLQTMAAMQQKAQEMTGVAVPKYYNPAAVNPLKYAEQVQKRKLLWSKKEKKEEVPDQWQGTAFQADQDGKMGAKFRKLMGMGEDASIEDEDLTEEQRHKREEVFARLDKDYEFARMSTHTHRGVGLGFASQGMSMPQFPQP